MNLKQLHYFKILAEKEHFTNAASELYISQPSLSYTISCMEQELGTSLFEKRGRNVVLTKHGRIFYKHVAKALEEMDCAISELQHNTDEQSGEVDIGSIPTVTDRFLPATMRAYLQRFPETNFHLFNGPTREIIEGIKSRRFDVGFCSRVSEEEELAFVPMLGQPIVAVLPQNHTLARYSLIPLEELIQFPLITYRENLPIGKEIRQMFAQKNLIPNITQTFDDEISLCGMVANGFGLAIAAKTAALKHENTTVVPLAANPETRMVCLAYHKEYYKTRAVQNYINFMRELPAGAYE